MKITMENFTRMLMILRALERTGLAVATENEMFSHEYIKKTLDDIEKDNPITIN